jgi:Flp pilus assembly protein TadG
VSRLLHILKDQAGSALLLFAAVLPLVAGGAAAAVDFASVQNAKAHLQSIADSAALSGAKELHVYQRNTNTLAEGVRQRALAMVDTASIAAVDPSVDATVDEAAATVTVTLGITPRTVLLGTLGYVDRVSATAVAGAYGSARLCVLALDKTAGGAIHATRIATVDAAECAVQANAPEPDAIALDLASKIQARAICSGGGVVGGDSAFVPPPQTDCPAVDDPLADRTLPPVGACDFRDMTILLPRTISPGHYCGGLTLGPTALVKALPGDYVISGGPLTLGAASSLTGENVSFRFVDEQSTFSFGIGSIVQLSAPTTGPMAGFLFYQDPGVAKEETFLIGSDLVTKLLGTIYLPSGTLLIDVIGLVAAGSAYTVVVADRIDVRGAHLVINSDYGATDVPVPAGIGPDSGIVSLAK